MHVKCLMLNPLAQGVKVCAHGLQLSSSKVIESFNFLNPTQTQQILHNSKIANEQITRTKRCHNAPHNALARIINLNPEKVKQ